MRVYLQMYTDMQIKPTGSKYRLKLAATACFVDAYLQELRLRQECEITSLY